MDLTKKGRTAVRVMADIARNDTDFVSISEISSRQGVSQKYLEKIIAMLVKANLLESMRGKTGGYKLIKKPEEYTIREILDATGDRVEIAACVDKSCPRIKACDTAMVWNTLNELINDYLNSITLKNLLDKTYCIK